MPSSPPPWTVKTRRHESGAGRDASVSTVIAPDLVEPIVGFREWVIVGDEIYSPLARTVWDDQPMQAECLARCHRAGGLWRHAEEHDGPAPDRNCVCGIYALFAPHLPRRRHELTRVGGAVVVWGRVEVHETGMRAEFARIVALALPNSSRQGPHRMVRRLAQRLGVHAVDACDVEMAALVYGQRVPAVLVPS